MSSDEESVDIDALNSNIDENNAILEVGEDFPEVEENETTEVQRDEAAEGESEVNKTVAVPPKRVVRNPQPKLNEETLKGPRGIATIQSHFEQVKFKGRGYEDQDLTKIMKTYEYWCHRLFPKFPFDTCIERLEKLGNKKAVKTHIKRIRFDLLIDEDKPIIDSSDEEANVEGFVDVPSDEINLQNHQFDSLQASASHINRNSTKLSEEQLQRMKMNKERAEKLRQERLKRINEKADVSLELSSQQPSTSDPFNEEQFDSQDTSSNQVNEEQGPFFDLESNIKGKSTIGGSSMKKISNKITSGNIGDKQEHVNDLSEKEINGNRLLNSDEEIECQSEISDFNVKEIDDVSNDGVRSGRKVQNIIDSDEEVSTSKNCSLQLQKSTIVTEESDSQHTFSNGESMEVA